MAVNLISEDFYKNLFKLKRKEKKYKIITKFFLYLGIIFLFLSFAPSLWYTIASRVDDFSKAIYETINPEKVERKVTADPVPDWQPAYNSNLSISPVLSIPSIKVETEINEASLEYYEEALKKGVWRVPDFGTPYDRSKPTILAAHRFGYLAWSNLYRRLNSFYNLPKLKNGDIVEIVYKQRKYSYEVYKESKGETIEDYSADLILYTCETLNSKIRIFKYARLLKI